MAYIEPPGLSAAQKTDLWQRWSQGQSLREGGWPLGEHADSIHGVVSSKWGNHSGRPAAVTSGTDIGEREEISRASRLVIPSDRSPSASLECRHRQVKSPAVAGRHIAPLRRMRRAWHMPTAQGSPRSSTLLCPTYFGIRKGRGSVVRMKIRTAYCVSIRARHRPVMLFPGMT